MSSTSKGRLNTLMEHLDSLFSSAHPQDVPELIKALRDDLSRRNAQARQPGYDKHVNVATASGHVVAELMTALAVIAAVVIGVTFLTLGVTCLSQALESIGL